MPLSMKFIKLVVLALLPVSGVLCSCQSTGKPTTVVTDGVVVSVPDQRLVVMRKGKVFKTYPVSTSKYGVGDQKGSNKTPLGLHSVAQKIGDDMPQGTVFKSRKPTGEVVAPNSPGRDPIVTRIIWLKGHESCNRNAYARMIYIHGTTEENRIGRPASYGCIRMKSSDISEMYAYLGKGEPVVIEACSLRACVQAAHDRVYPKTEPARHDSNVMMASAGGASRLKNETRSLHTENAPHQFAAVKSGNGRQG